MADPAAQPAQLPTPLYVEGYAWRGSVQVAPTIPNNTLTPMSWVTEIGGGNVDLADPTKVKVKIAGWYAVTFNFAVDYAGNAIDATKTYAVVVGRNGFATHNDFIAEQDGALFSGGQEIECSGLIRLAAGDYVQGALIQTTGGNVSCDAAGYTNMTIVRVAS